MTSPAPSSSARLLAPATSGEIAELTDGEVAPVRTLVMPLGSTEQHGPHLPLSTDTDIAEAWAHAFASAVDEPVLVAPVLAYGAAGEHQSFAGTLSIGTEALIAVVVELIRSASGRFARTILLSGHAGNAEGLERAKRQLRHEGHSVDVVLPVLHGADSHAGRAETSLMLHLRPELVRTERAQPGATESLVDLLPRLRTGGTAAVSANGVLGDPAGATADEGSRLLAELVAHARAVTGL